MTKAEANTTALLALLERWKYVEDRRKGKPETSTQTYARAGLQQECAAVAGTPVGTGLNDRLAASAFSVGTLVQPEGLTFEEAFEALYSAARTAGANDPPKDRSTIERQLREGMKRPRDLASLNGHHKNGKPSAGTRTLRVPAEAAEPLPVPPSAQVEPFPLDVLPPPLVRFVQEGAASLCCPPDYLAVPMLCAASSAIGASRALRLTGDWWVFPALYAAVVAPPSSAKSPAASRSLAAIKYQQVANSARFKADRKAWDEADPATRTAERPKLCRTYTTDVTTEKLASLLADCPRGLLYHRDELVAWIASFNQYRDGGKGADQQVFMSIWDHQSISIERKAHDDGLPITVQRPCLTVFGTIQPDVLGQLTQSQDGFIERILFSFADPVGERRWSWEGISADARKQWRDLIARLYSLALSDPLEEGDDPWPQFVTFAESARPTWENWYAAHQAARADLPEAMHACHAKLESYCARLSLLIELLWYATDADHFDLHGGPDVSSGAVECGALLVRYFLSHARRAYGRLELTPEDQRIDRVVAWIRKHGGQCTARELMAGHQAKGAEAAHKLIEKLVDRCLGTVVTERHAANGKDVVTFRLHPSSAASADPALTDDVSAL